MDVQATYIGINRVLAGTQPVGSALEIALAALGLIAAIIALVPAARPYRRWTLGALAALLLGGELVLVRVHWELYQLMAVVDPATGIVGGHVAAPLWIESEKLYVWALIVAVMGLFMRRQRDELLSGVLLCIAVLTIGGALLGKPFTSPLPGLVGQYSQYLQAMSMGGQAASGAYQGMEAARQYYYNAWFMWVHPPLLFFSYGAFVISFVATVRMIRERHSAFETTAYRWARLGYISLTAGMLLGFPWALMSWQGESWWWSGKVNMSIMMWMLYTAYLHARLYLRTRGMWKAVAAIAVLSFLILVLTYLATYVVPGAHSYASAETGGMLAAFLGERDLMSGIEDIRQRVWDFWLTIVTVVVLAALGVQSFIGTGYVWWAERSIPEWETGPGYAAYVALMNQIAAPLLLVLVLVMGLCVPKRLFSRTVLIGVSAAMVAAGMVVWVATGEIQTGLAVYLALAATIQVAVVALTVVGVRGPSYLTEGRLTKTGSGLLHLGFILFGIVVVALQRSTWMLPVFSAATLLSITGTALAFYASRLGWHRSGPREEGAFEWSARDAADSEDESGDEDEIDAD